MSGPDLWDEEKRLVNHLLRIVRLALAAAGAVILSIMAAVIAVRWPH